MPNRQRYFVGRSCSCSCCSAINPLVLISAFVFSWLFVSVSHDSLCVPGAQGIAIFGQDDISSIARRRSIATRSIIRRRADDSSNRTDCRRRCSRNQRPNSMRCNGHGIRYRRPQHQHHLERHLRHESLQQSCPSSSRPAGFCSSSSCVWASLETFPGRCWNAQRRRKQFAHVAATNSASLSGHGHLPDGPAA